MQANAVRCTPRSNSELRARSKRRPYGTVRTDWRVCTSRVIRSTHVAAVFAIRLPAYNAAGRGRPKARLLAGPGSREYSGGALRLTVSPLELHEIAVIEDPGVVLTKSPAFSRRDLLCSSVALGAAALAGFPRASRASPQGLQSAEFKDDKLLQACLVNDAAHIQQGATGPHVSKIQVALASMGYAVIESERTQMYYGSSTADAVKRFKSDWEIINPSYQSAPDSIVGKMTIKELDEAMVYKTYYSLSPPPIVAQAKSWACWAACLESWLTVTPGREMYSQAQLLAMFAPWADPTTGELKMPEGWNEVEKKFRIQHRLFDSSRADTPTRLTSAYLLDLLKGQGFLLIIFRLSRGGAAHTNVLFGVRKRSTGNQVRVMDPMKADRLQRMELDYFTHPDREIVGVFWPAK